MTYASAIFRSLAVGLRRFPLAGLFLLLSFTSNAIAAELIMVRQAGCPWCILWDREIGPIYPVSAEGRFAPLRQLDIREPLPAFVEKPVTVTPTFILIEGNREIGRLVGYPGDSYFWEMLSEIFAQSSFAPSPEQPQSTN